MISIEDSRFTSPKYSATINELRKFFAKYWLVVFIFGSVVAFTQATLFLTKEAKGDIAIIKSSFFIDHTYELTFASVNALPDEQWRERDVESLKFRPANGKIWLKIAIPAQKEKSAYLRFNNPSINTVDIKLLTASQTNKDQSVLLADFNVGDRKAFHTRDIALPEFVIPLNLPQQASRLFISISPELAIDLNFGLWSQQGLIEFNNHISIFFGIVFGYLAALFCYSLTMYATVQKSEYLWYGLYLGGFLLHAMTLSGFAFQYLWPEGTGLQAIMSGVSLSLSFLCLVKFTQKIIATKSKRYNQGFNFLVYGHVASCLMSVFTQNPLFLKFHLVAVALTAISVPLICSAIAKEGSKVARFFVLVWLVYLVTCLIAILGILDYIYWPLNHVYTLMLGFHIESLLIGSALIYGYRMTYIQTLKMKELALKEKEKSLHAKNQILKLQQDAKDKLEEQVKAQTTQLESALSNLSLASAELQIIRNLDGLTGLPNRLAFEEGLDRLCQSSLELGLPLCICVVDIDHFKKVNDCYGHIAGDDCLRAVSAQLKNSFDLKDFHYCRYGGEEFIIASLLPIEQVLKTVEHFRLTLEEMTIRSGAHEISITISAGIASKKLRKVSDSRRVLSLADENLYLAKHKGRNLVVA